MLAAVATLATLSALTVILLPVASTRADLAGQYQAGQSRASALQSQINAEGTKIQGFQGSISLLQTRLTAIDRSVAIQQRLLDSSKQQLTSARSRLEYLVAEYTRDRHVLAAQLVADYESPPPTLVDVIVDTHGFNNLLTTLTNMRTIARRNAQETTQVGQARIAVAAETRRLAGVEAHHQRATAAVLVERDEVAQLKLSIVNRELPYARARAHNLSALSSLQKTLVRQAATLSKQAAAAQSGATGSVPPPPGGCINTPFVAHGGEWGFFQAPGTNYSVNEEPVIAARLDALGKALQLHLIGISGYRTPQHSVEVGGYADDPHTKGEASDTPGVEGVPEGTLEEFCLTRPFPGAAEADHIQELGSPT